MSAPLRLIDPDGEGVYLLTGDDSWDFREIAFEFFGDVRQWRDIEHKIVFMIEDDEGLWHVVKRRWWHGFLMPRYAPVSYTYLAPIPY